MIEGRQRDKKDAVRPSLNETVLISNIFVILLVRDYFTHVFAMCGCVCGREFKIEIKYIDGHHIHPGKAQSPVPLYSWLKINLVISNKLTGFQCGF